MTERTLPGDPPIFLRLRRTAQARRLTLRVSSLDGRVTLTVPAHVGDRDAMAFAKSREDWLRSRLSGVAGRVAVGCGTVLPVGGVPTRLVLRRGGLAAAPGTIEAPSVEAVERHLKTVARERISAAVERHAAALGRAVTAISLRDPRSRWGSCSSAGRLMFSWRLILAPPAVLDYVAAHEVAHLERMDHSPAYWDVVARLVPGYRAERAWLRREGTGLHRWQFRH